MLPQNKPDRIRILFDDHRLVANAGLLLPATLARHLGLRELVDHHLDLGGAPGRANTGDKMPFRQGAYAWLDLRYVLPIADLEDSSGVGRVLDHLVRMRDFVVERIQLGPRSSEPEDLGMAPDGEDV